MNDETILKQWVQPGLLGMIDGSISTLAPLYALSALVSDPWIVFLAVMSTTLGAAVSMAGSEGLSDDGVLTGRGRPLQRGTITGLGTFLGGALHTLPFLLPSMLYATILATVVVVAELVTISYVRWRYFNDITFRMSLVQVAGFGAVVTGIGLVFGHG